MIRTISPGRHQDRVFPAELGVGGRLAVAIENLKLDQVDVERVSLTAAIIHFPDLNVSQSHDLINSAHIHCLAVDRRPRTGPTLGKPSSLSSLYRPSQYHRTGFGGRVRRRCGRWC